MESLVQSRICDRLTEADGFYLKGIYDKCVQTFRLTCEEVKATQSLLEVCNVDKCVFCCLIENNILVSRGLALKWNFQDAYSEWNDVMQNFSELHQQVKSLQMVYRVPLKCYLNIVYNALYWGWWHPNGLQCDESHIETCMQIAVSCFKRVLEVCHDACPSSSFCNIQDVVLCLMKRVANCLLEVSGEEGQQLVEISIVVTYMLIELKAKREIIAECTSIIICILHMRSQLVPHVLSAFESRKKDAMSSFRFGLHEVNSTMGKCNIETVLEVLKNACCVCFIQLEQYAKCVTCLEDSENGDIKFQSLHNYTKAYACYHSNDTEACLLSLHKLESVPLSTQMKVRGHLLRGSLLAKQGRHSEALQEFFKPLSIGLQDTREKKDFYPVTLYHIAEEYGALHCMCKTHTLSDVKAMQDHGKSSSQQVELLQAALQSDHLDTLRHVVQVLKDNDDHDDDDSAGHTSFTFNIQLKILNILHPQPEINLPVALFKLATTLAANGDCSSAGQIFMELLAQPGLQPLPSLVAQLPHVSIMYHSAAVLLLKSNELHHAEHLCRQAISYHSSKSYSSTDMEHCLLCLEDDLVALMLLAQVHKHKGDEIMESETLDRCLRLVSNYKRNQGSEKDAALREEGAGETHFIHLLSALEAKLHLQKAQNYLRRGQAFQNDSFFELKQSLLCNCEDQEVTSSYSRFLHEYRQYSGHDRSVPPNRSSKLHVENCCSLALKHLLQSQASEESDLDLFLES